VRRNHLRELLRAGKPSLGTRLQASWPTVTELVGHSANFDYVEFLAEYAPYDLYALENLGRAIDLFDDFSGLIKIEQDSRTRLAVKAMWAGIQNLLFTDIRSVVDAEECVRAVRPETPEGGGLHGVLQGRNARVILDTGSPELPQSYEDAVIMLMIEKKQAVENLPAILSVKGVDMVQFGPSDYSMSIGVHGQRMNPAVKEAERYTIETSLKMGIQPRAEIQSPDQAEYYLNLGVRHFNLGSDMAVLFAYFRDQGGQMREILKAL
jgi:2-keto-3-deoxy-L-rhamnonate aldolase RhmA